DLALSSVSLRRVAGRLSVKSHLSPRRRGEPETWGPTLPGARALSCRRGVLVRHGSRPVGLGLLPAPAPLGVHDVPNGYLGHHGVLPGALARHDRESPFGVP